MEFFNGLHHRSKIIFMSKSIKLQVPQPCNEDWNKFDKTEKGGFCGSCSKEVIDFTTLSDQEIKEYFLSSRSSKVCGRFNKEQLNRNIGTTPAGNSSFLKAASIAVGLTASFASIPVK